MRAFALLLLVGLVGCKKERDAEERGPLQPRVASTEPGIVRVHESPKLTSIEVSGRTDTLGRPLRVACVTCHAVRGLDGGAPATGRRFPARSADLREFHAGLFVKHGELPCLSCHVDRVGGEPKLHLADGTELATADAMRLCAQCHGARVVEYEHGAHGGMTGHWDLSRGGRERNHCVDCHDPHFPPFQPTRPVLPPRDRGLSGGDHG